MPRSTFTPEAPEGIRPRAIPGEISCPLVGEEAGILQQLFPWEPANSQPQRVSGSRLASLEGL